MSAYPLPRAILFDMDDTILSAYGQPEKAWVKVASEFGQALGPIPAAEAAAAMTRFAKDFWAKADSHKYWRLNLPAARREVALGGFQALAAAGYSVPSKETIFALADRFSELREEEMFVFPGALETLDKLRELGIRMALITNGDATAQRSKVERFDLARRFDHVQIEGEHGFGKPEAQAYHHAMGKLDVGPGDTWMVGDNLEWEVVTPQRLGIYAVWCDAHGVGLPADSAIKPDRIIRRLPELLTQV